MLQFRSRYTAEAAIYNEDDITLAECVKLIGRPRTLAAVVLIIGELTENINVGKNMTDRQVATLAQDIMDMYYYFNIGELTRQFVLMRRHGNFYDRCDGNIILKWLANYDNNERCDICERVEQEKAKLHKPNYIEPIKDLHYKDLLSKTQ